MTKTEREFLEATERADEWVKSCTFERLEQRIRECQGAISLRVTPSGYWERQLAVAVAERLRR